jgi:hypothetical protein
MKHVPSRPLREPHFFARVLLACSGQAPIKALLIFALVLGLQSCSSNNGVSSPTPMFIGFDAPGAGIRGDAGTFPQQINQSGEAVGWLLDANLIVHAFIRDSSGSITVFDAPGATTKCCSGTFALSINSAGTFTGYFADDTFTIHGFVRTQGGVVTTFDALPGSPITQPYSINDSGVITGAGYDPNTQVPHGFVRATDGTITIFDVSGGIGTFPIGINDAGVVTGSVLSPVITRGFIRGVDGTITVLDAPGAAPPCSGSGCETHPMGINASGAIVGRALVSGTVHSFLRDANGAFTVFDPPGTVAADGGSLAVGISDGGSIIGNFMDSNGAHGYLRDASGNFTTLDFPNSQGTAKFVTSVAGINTSGAILGTYEDAFFVTHGFVRE